MIDVSSIYLMVMKICKITSLRRVYPEHEGLRLLNLRHGEQSRTMNSLMSNSRYN